MQLIFNIINYTSPMYQHYSCEHATDRKGGCYGWTPSSSSTFSIRAFRAQNHKFELFELIPLLKLLEQLPVEQFEAAVVSQSAVPFPLLTNNTTANNNDDNNANNNNNRKHNHTRNDSTIDNGNATNN